MWLLALVARSGFSHVILVSYIYGLKNQPLSPTIVLHVYPHRKAKVAFKMHSMLTPPAAFPQDEVLYEGVERTHSHSTKADTEEEGGEAEQNVRPCTFYHNVCL